MVSKTFCSRRGARSTSSGGVFFCRDGVSGMATVELGTTERLDLGQKTDEDLSLHTHCVTESIASNKDKS